MAWPNRKFRPWPWRWTVQAVFAGRDYEPQTIARDHAVKARLQSSGIQLALVKDHVIFEERELLTHSGKPYTVFAPYLRAWLAKLDGVPLPEKPSPHPAWPWPPPCPLRPARAQLARDWLCHQQPA